MFIFVDFINCYKTIIAIMCNTAYDVAIRQL